MLTDFNVNWQSFVASRAIGIPTISFLRSVSPSLKSINTPAASQSNVHHDISSPIPSNHRSFTSSASLFTQTRSLWSKPSFLLMSSSTHPGVANAALAESTEAPTQLQENLTPVPLKYIPLPIPLPTLDTAPISITAAGDMRPPCRRCLQDASPGEEVHLIAYDPFPADSVTPYRGTGPIFVHAHDCGVFEGATLPERQLRRLMSVRAYDEKHMMAAAEVVEGEELERVAGGMLADEKAKYVNVHNAKAGCFAVRVERG